MKLKILPLVVLVLFIGGAVSASASASYDCTRLTRNLRLGMTGNDVTLLQQLLNKQISTRVSEAGPGSPGNEGIYFGAKTLQAVKHFQELYASEVLTPAGLSVGSGFVGALSRAKLKSICTGNITPPQNVKSGQTQTNANPPPAANTSSTNSLNTAAEKIPTESIASPAKYPNLKPYLMYPGNYAVHQGDKLIIYGGGYSTITNTVNIGSLTFTDILPTKIGTLEVTIPSNAVKGKFDLWFSNAKGSSNKSFMIITDPSAVPPKVSSFTPNSGLNGTQVTITGTNFSSDWNEIVVGTGTVKAGPSSDGKTLSFTAALPIPGVVGNDISNVKASIPLWFYIINPNGVSQSSIFTLKI